MELRACAADAAAIRAEPSDDAEQSDAHQQEAAGESIHVAFWLGDGRILHATEREDASGVVEEDLGRTRSGNPVRFARP